MFKKNLFGISLILILIITNVHCGCDEDDNNDEIDDGKVKQFLKTVSCTLKTGAEKVSEGAKKLGENAKKFGQNIKEKFIEYKDKLTSDDNNNSPSSSVQPSIAQLPPVPQRPLPLAPLKEENDQPNNFDLRFSNSN